MVQAARSGRQNIAEGSRAAATSIQTELRLMNVARASMDELLLDYEDYLRQHFKRQWTKYDPEACSMSAWIASETVGCSIAEIAKATMRDPSSLSSASKRISIRARKETYLRQSRVRITELSA